MAAKLEKTRHPGIYRRGGRYVVVWRHRGKQHKSFHRTLAEAREAKGQRDAGERTPTTRQPFEEFAREWLEGYAGRTNRGLSEGTRRDYRRSLEQFAVPYFRGCRLADIEPKDVRQFVRHLEHAGLAPTSVVKNLAPVRAMFATAVEAGAVGRNPTIGVRVTSRPSEAADEAEAKAMTRSELAELLGTLPEDWRLFFELLAHTGLRISEALGLDWSDVEFGEQPVLHIRRQHYRGATKGLKSRAGRRVLPLSPGMARRLWAARPAGADGAMFATRTGSRYGDRNIRRVLDRAAERTGVPWISFHTFRHTAASILFEQGKNIRQVSQWLGHADPAFTLRTYVHLMDDGLGDATVLDTAIQVGNRRATEGPETAANPGGSDLFDIAVQSQNAEQPQRPATLAAYS